MKITRRTYLGAVLLVPVEAAAAEDVQDGQGLRQQLATYCWRHHTCNALYKDSAGMITAELKQLEEVAYLGERDAITRVPQIWGPDDL